MSTSCLFVQSKKHQAETPWQLSIALAINTCLCTPVSPRQDSVRYKDGLVFPEPDDPSSLQHTSRSWPSCLASIVVFTQFKVARPRLVTESQSPASTHTLLRPLAAHGNQLSRVVGEVWSASWAHAGTARLWWTTRWNPRHMPVPCEKYFLEF